MESSKPQVLLFTDWYLPGYKAGGPISSCANLVRLLGDEINFKIVCSDRDYLDSEPYQNVNRDTWVEVGNASVYYLSKDKFSKSVIRERILEYPGAVIYINGIFSRDFSITPLLAANRLNRKIFVAPRGMLAEGALSIKAKKKRTFLSLAKFLGLYRQVSFHATNHQEADQIKKVLSRRAAITVIPNLPTIPNDGVERIEKSENHLEIISVARIAPEKNTLFAIQCLQSIDSHLKVRVKFYGPIYDEAYFQECEKAAAGLPNNVEVKFLGSIPPDKLSLAFAEAHLFLLPTLGENYGHAIVESMLAGVPVLISDKTPWRNLEADNLGMDLPLADSSSFTKYICKLAAMDQTDYDNQYRTVAKTIEKRIHLAENIMAYKMLFG